MGKTSQNVGFDKVASICFRNSKIICKSTKYILFLKLACCYQVDPHPQHNILDGKEQRKSSFSPSLEFLEFRERFPRDTYVDFWNEDVK